MSKVRIGVQIQPQHADYSQIRDAAARVEDAGADVLFNWDHFYPLSGDPDGKHFECWTMLAAWAEQTEKVELGALVTCNSYRNANLLADMARTVDHISDGRLILGMGSGWFEKDYQNYGYDFGTVGSRLDELATAMPVIEQRWKELNPPPTRDIPVMIGGGGEKKTLRLVAKHAQIWHSFGDLETFTRKTGILKDWCAKEGTDFNAIELSVGVEGKDPEKDGTALKDAGAGLFTMGSNGPDYNLDELKKWVAWRDSVNAG